MLIALDGHLAAGVLAEEDLVALLHVERLDLAVLTDLSVAGCNYFALLGLFLGGIRNDDSAFGLLLFIDSLYENAIVERTNLPGSGSSELWRGVRAPFACL